MTSTTPASIQTLDAEVDRLERELADLEAALADVRHKAANGAKGISHDSVSTAVSKVEFAELQLDAARRRAAEGREREHAERIDAFEAEVAAYRGGAELAAKLRSAEAAVAEFLIAIKDRDDVLAEFNVKSHELGQGPLGTLERVGPAQSSQALSWMLRGAVRKAGVTVDFVQAEVHGSIDEPERIYERLSAMDKR